MRDRIATEEAEAALARVAPQVAAALGWLVIDNEQSHYRNLLGPAGEQIHVRVEDGRFHFGSHYERDARSGYELRGPSITLAHTRPVPHIVAEIQRRLLPEYLKARAAYLERVTETDQRAAETRATAALLAPALPGLGRPGTAESPRISDDELTATAFVYQGTNSNCDGFGGWHAEATIRGTRVDLRLDDIGAEHVIAIMNLLRSWGGK